MGNELDSSVRTRSALNHAVISLAPLSEIATLLLCFVSFEHSHFRLLIDPEVDVELWTPPKAYE